MMESPEGRPISQALLTSSPYRVLLPPAKITTPTVEWIISNNKNHIYTAVFELKYFLKSLSLSLKESNQIIRYLSFTCFFVN